jgi:uncharacterized protein (TIGR03083 family)
MLISAPVRPATRSRCAKADRDAADDLVGRQVTVQALAATNRLYDQLFGVLDGASPDQWGWPSNCPGWRIHDVVGHLAASARQSRDPLPAMLPLPVGLARERQHDYEVTRRIHWSVPEVLEELRTYAPRKLRLLEKLQAEPAASQAIDLPGLGVYPSHAVANAAAFDLYCHLYLDIAPVLGLSLTTDDIGHEVIYPIIQWMMWGLPQMQGSVLADTVDRPITLRLSGPGDSAWTVRRCDEDAGLVVSEADDGIVTVTSTARDFICWGTKRAAWQPLCTVTGERGLVAEFLGTLNII